MFSLSSVWAVALRHIRLWRHDTNNFLMLFYWPLLDIITWGYFGAWIQQQSLNTQVQNYEITLLMGVLLWQMVGRGCNAILFPFCEEIWSNNLVNLFSLPLRLAEWIVGIIFLTIIVIIMILLLSILVISCLYDVSVWRLVRILLIFAPPLFLSTLWLGFSCLQIIVMLGRRSVEFAFVVLWFVMPFSGVYYPLEVLPNWLQTVAAFLPMSHIFQGMRGYVMHQQDPTVYLIKGSALGLLYAICGLLGFVYCFNRSKVKGLARLAD